MSKRSQLYHRLLRFAVYCYVVPCAVIIQHYVEDTIGNLVLVILMAVPVTVLGIVLGERWVE